MASSNNNAFWAAVGAVRKKAPLVQCITNYVSMDIMANGLLAAGASPAMVHAVEELPSAVQTLKAISGALSINIGTLDEAWIRSFKSAASLASSTGVPWVLDPVAAGFTKLRTDTAVELLGLRPTVVRGNGSEILALGGAVTSGKGVDSTRGSDDAVETAKQLAVEHGCVVVVSGAVDYVTDGRAVLEVRHGVETLTKITAAGCLVSSIVAAFVAARPEGQDVMHAAAFALAFYGMCAEIAAERGREPSGCLAGCLVGLGLGGGRPSRPCGPGTLRVKLLDTMYSLDKASAPTLRIKEVLPS